MGSHSLRIPIEGQTTASRADVNLVIAMAGVKGGESEGWEGVKGGRE